MAEVIKRVIVEVDSDTRKLQKGFKQVDKRVGFLTKNVKRLGGALIAAFGSRALLRGFQQTIRTTDALVKNARGVGFTAGEYERLTFALSQVGVEAGSAKIAIGDFQKRLSKAVGGNKSFAKAFREAGLDIRALSAMGPSAAFLAAFQGLSGQLGDPRIAGLFGNVFEEQSGKDMLKAARSLKEFNSAYKDYARIAGKGITGDDADSFEQLSKETRKLQLRFTVLRRTIVLKAIPQILEAFEEMEKKDVFKKMADSVTELINNINKLIGIIPGLMRGKAEFEYESSRFNEEAKRRGFVRALFDSETGEDPVARLLNAGQGRMGEFLSGKPMPSNTPLGAPTPFTRAGFGSGAGAPVVITQHNRFAVDPSTNARLEDAWRKANDKAMRAVP